MSAPMLLRGMPLLRLRIHRQVAAGFLMLPQRRTWWSFLASADSSRAEEEEVSSAAKGTTSSVMGFQDPPKHHKLDHPDYRSWKDQEEEILRDIEPITSLAKQILHSDRYMDGECLTDEDERAVVEKLLAHHPHSEDKIGCGLDSIMVDRHPQFRRSRCLFVVRTDGGWIDFSYQKCLRAYIRDKYPSHAERFIREHFKRGSN
ncbi:DUF3223 domain-containing protein [Cephalotus follicularis]|uniref:DUF3223 domain-containing protein n=1 Tax=Cephalotus follicularis TaxID=3775 RepID=A0A1Q3BN26_CEPFO|nr:DUF3223 domain-containing protein [Cephalotus follicularis]